MTLNILLYMLLNNTGKNNEKKESSVLNFFLKFKIYWCLRVGCFISEHFDILTSQLASIALLISWTFIIQINIIAWSYTIKRWYLLNWWNYQFMFMFTHQNLLLCTLIHVCSQRFWYATSDLSYIKKLLYSRLQLSQLNLTFCGWSKIMLSTLHHKYLIGH